MRNPPPSFAEKAEIFSMNPEMVKRTPHPGLPIGSADCADAEREKRFQRLEDGTLGAVRGFFVRIFWGGHAPHGHTDFLKALATFTAGMVALVATGKDFLVYFGTYTNALSRGIYVSRLNADTGALSAPELAAETPSPSYLAVSPDEKFLYANNSVQHFNGGHAGGVSAFAIDQATGRLTALNAKSSRGDDPCYVSTDATGRELFAANYNSGSLSSFRLEPNGWIGADGSLVLHHGASVNKARQSGPHAHCICADPSNRFALACDLGLDQVFVYTINPVAGTLAEHSVARVPPGSGPRHLAFSTDRRFVQVVNEMGCSVTTFAWDKNSGQLQPVETVSALPPGVALRPSFTAAEIVVAGSHVYVTLRGHDSVSVFTADPGTGRLTFLQNISAGGKVPRGLGIDPTHHWLMVGNQKSNNAVEFTIDGETGKLAPTGRELKIGSPVDVKFVDGR